jgi:hypothetical protein
MKSQSNLPGLALAWSTVSVTFWQGKNEFTTRTLGQKSIGEMGVQNVCQGALTNTTLNQGVTIPQHFCWPFPFPQCRLHRPH